jgi:hypothetical protein
MRRIVASCHNFSDYWILVDFCFASCSLFAMASRIRKGCQVRVIGGTIHIGKKGVIRRITTKMCWRGKECLYDDFRFCIVLEFLTLL